MEYEANRRGKDIVNKPNNISHKEAKDFLDSHLEQGYCISQMNGKPLDNIVYHHP